MSTTVLRLNHRAGRDKRVTTHLFLCARAFGADSGVLSGDSDSKLLGSVNKVSEEWGGVFKVSYVKDWRSFIKNFEGVKIHLTMYGLPVQDCVEKFQGKDLLVIVGGAKVPSEVYELVDFNVSVTSQPHSEISALSVFLDKLFEGSELSKGFAKARRTITPARRGKKVVSKK
jgi:tRNA (cytidine56-2'-O)-methyltransferase